MRRTLPKIIQRFVSGGTERPQPGEIGFSTSTLGIEERVLNVTGLHEQVRSAQLCQTGGLHPKSVFHVETHSGEHLAVKYAHSPGSGVVSGEIQGIEIMLGSPLGHRIIPPHFVSHEHEVIVMPWFDGVQLGQGMRDGTFSQTQAREIVSELMDGMHQWASQQQKRPYEGENVSFQRQEWVTVLTELPAVIERLAILHGVSPTQLLESPIVINGSSLNLSLAQIIQVIDEFYREDPPYVQHVNVDAKRTNILVDASDHTNWRLIDHEFVGDGDPAEAIAIAAKYVSGSSVSAVRDQNLSLGSDDGVMHIHFNATVPAISLEIQAHGLSQLDKFAQALEDPSFAVRAYKYLAGSYLKEFAFTVREGKLDLALFLLAQAAEAVQTAQNLEREITVQTIAQEVAMRPEVTARLEAWTHAYAQVASYFGIPFDGQYESIASVSHQIEEASITQVASSNINMLVISGPSASGKGNVVTRLRGEGLQIVPNYTTRPPRPGEQDGTDKLFVTEQELDALIAQGDILTVSPQEHSQQEAPYRAAFGRAPLEHVLQNGQGVIVLEKSPRGWVKLHRIIAEQFPETLALISSQFVFLLPETPDTLITKAIKRVLRERGIVRLDQITEDIWQLINLHVDRALGDVTMVTDALQVEHPIFMVVDDYQRVQERLRKLYE